MDGSVCCYHAAVRWQRRDHAEQKPGRIRLAPNRGKAPCGPNSANSRKSPNSQDKNGILRVAAANVTSLRKLADSLQKLARAAVAVYAYQPTGSESEEYHKWYFNTFVWKKTTWMGVNCWKSVADMWNYQEILFELKPSLVIEFGTAHGGSALFFANIMRQIGAPFKVLSVDITHERLEPAARRDPDIVFVESRSTVPAVAEHIQRLKNDFPGKIFAILDSDHTKDNVLAEMKLLRPLLSAGDYLIVEDSTLNGHPVLPGWGPGPYEAIEAYEQEFPDDYTHDVERETKFGWTFAPHGYLIRT
ncbi:rhamnosyl O-methyltransferase [Mycobacterium botniense]|uniref:rhamnosyl O-methyltransferase n=1 Tax=Mycobacterium botniense TaxID=84962 RepID=UPI001C3F5A98